MVSTVDSKGKRSTRLTVLPPDRKPLKSRGRPWNALLYVNIVDYVCV